MIDMACSIRLRATHASIQYGVMCGAASASQMTNGRSIIGRSPKLIINN